MSVDQALLAESEPGGALVLRLYRWEEPTLSLGYFQEYADRDRHAASLEAPVVRRQSGGGAIVHDRELTYSLVVPAGHRLARRPPLLYEVVHHAIIGLLTELAPGGDDRQVIRLCGEGDTRPEAEPFLCFQRRSAGDVLIVGDAGAHKVVGSAQRRLRGAILQHGSVLLGRSDAAPELPGVCDLIEGVPGSLSARLVDRLPVALSSRLGVGFLQSALESPTIAAAREISRQRYGCSKWTLRR